MMKRFFGCILSGLVATVASASADGDALVALLNSRSSQSPRAYAAAVGQVRVAADAGGVLQRFVIAVISEDENVPRAARLTPEQRVNWLDDTREKVRQMAEKKDNPMAWYLLSLENNDVRLLERAADGGNIQALNAWGTILVSEAMTVPSTNATKATTMLEKGYLCFNTAAGKKDANGMYNLGMCYLQGLGCSQDAGRAFEWFCLAAENGHPEAINNIGGFYRDGIVVATNVEMSVRWFKKSAELGNPYGQLNYALALQRGDGVAKDEKTAAEYFEASAVQGCVEAMAAYGMCFHAGRGVKKDAAQAFKWFRRSAEAGFPPAMDNLAICYERGEGTTRDVLQSALWKMRARAAHGDPDARAWVERQETSVGGVEEKR